ncbi:MAG: hypothetical protein IJU70_09885, partial [Lentisphaeria bacterium]|nr:hypothetical protein [Lentisphaeria bacterium]
VAAYVLVPREAAYECPISVQLLKNGRTVVYPSGRPFSANDIISTVVLQQVYEDNKLSAKLSFDDFCRLFYISGINIRKSILTASYQSKFSKRNLSFAEVKALEQEYSEALQKLDHSAVRVAMSSTPKLAPGEAVRILRQVPVTWFKIYSKLEVKVVPRTESVARVQGLRDGVALDGWLITLDRARRVCRNLTQTCRELQEVTMGQKIGLESGELLEDVQNRLVDLELHRIRPLLLLVLENPDYKRNSLDDVFLRSAILDLERRIEVLRERFDGAAAGINILQARTPVLPSKTAPSADQSSPVTFNSLDSSFFASLSELIRSSQSVELREKYAADALKFKENMAELTASKAYYEHLLKQLGAPRNSEKNSEKKVVADQFNRLEKILFQELLDLCGKVNAFQEMIMKRYVSDRLFFSTTGDVLKVSQVPPFLGYFITVLSLLCVAVVGVYVGLRFYFSFARGELKK